MLRIAICDDEQKVHDELRKMLLEYSVKYEQEFFIQDYLTADELLVAPFNYDILFLDIMLDEQNDGIQLGVKLRKRDNRALYIILTSRSDRTSDGYEATTFRFLVKPLAQEMLEKVLKAAEIHMALNFEQHFTVYYRGQRSYPLVKDIIMIESYMRQRHIITDDQDFPTTETWQSLLDRLRNYTFSIRIGKNFYVNMEKIQSTTTNSITLTNKRVITLTKAAQEKFVKEFGRYMRTKGE